MSSRPSRPDRGVETARGKFAQAGSRPPTSVLQPHGKAPVLLPISLLLSRRATVVAVVVTGSLILSTAVAGALKLVAAGHEASIQRSETTVRPDSSSKAVLAGIAACESAGNAAAVSPDGRYRGKYQFDLPTWQTVGGQGDPALAPEMEQDRRAKALLSRRGTQPWPSCRRTLPAAAR